MEHNSSAPKSSSSSRPPAATEGILLIAGGAWTVAGAASAAIYLIFAARNSDQDMTPAILLAVLMVLAGVSLMGFFWAIARIVRRQYESTLRSRRTTALLEQVAAQLQSGARASSQGAPGSDSQLSQRVLAELVEVNSNLLLSESQRETKRRNVQLQRGSELAKDAMAALDSDRLHQAEQTVKRLRDEVPDFPDLPMLENRLQQRRQTLMDQEIQELSLRVKDLLGSGNFDQAMTTARLLGDRYPHSQGPSLVQQVQREKAAFETERRGVMYQQINKFVEARQWRSALTAARQFLDAHPNSPESDLIRAQMQTLVDNAQIEEVRRLRDEFRDHVNAKKFVEAYDVARDLVNRFPGTAAAEELRGQMDRLAARAQSGDGQKGDAQKADTHKEG